MSMFRLSRKFVALLLAVWLPLFSGNALAVSVAKRTMSGDCHTHTMMAAQSGDHPSQYLSAADYRDQFAASQDREAVHGDQQNSSHDCGVCQLACCGYVATLAIKVAEVQSLAQTFMLSSTQFQSITLPLFDPPPIARA
jgi:hypothetical protein